jgi:hypothetical protein
MPLLGYLDLMNRVLKNLLMASLRVDRFLGKTWLDRLLWDSGLISLLYLILNLQLGLLELRLNEILLIMTWRGELK